MDDYRTDPQYRALMANALQTPGPSYTPAQALINALTQGLKGYQAGQFRQGQETKQADYSKALASALAPEPVSNVAITPPITQSGQVAQRQMAGDYSQPTEDNSQTIAKLLASPNSDVRNDFEPAIAKSQIDASALSNQPVTPYQRAEFGQNKANNDRALQQFLYGQKSQDDRAKASLDQAASEGEKNRAARLAAAAAGRAPQNQPPSGYRQNPDGTMAFIPGGPADPSIKPKSIRPLPTKAVNDLSGAGTTSEAFQRLKEGFKPQFGGHFIAGELSNTIGRTFGDNTGQTDWWSDYQTQKNLIRNKLFGSALTATEKAEFDKANVAPGMDPAIIQRNLARQSSLADQAARKLAKAYGAAGYDPQSVEGALGMSLEMLPNSPMPQYGAQPQGQPAPQSQAGALPQGVTEEDVQFTAKKYGMSREDVLHKLGGR